MVEEKKEGKATVTIGPVAIEVEVGERGITRIDLPAFTEEVGGRSESPPHLNIKDSVSPEQEEWLADLTDYLERIFSGREPSQGPPADLSGLSEFTVKALESAARIPWGETRSYEWIAQSAGNGLASRAAGGAMGRNPVPLLIPCHRVIRKDGSVGWFGAGPRWKRRLLELESVDRGEN